MRKQILRSMCALLLLAAVLMGVLVGGAVYIGGHREMQQQTMQQARIIQAGYHQSGGRYLEEISKSAAGRITHIAADGGVLFDSAADAGSLENHLQRPEIELVLAGQESAATSRFSDTLGMQTFYYACRLEDGTILRIAVTTNQVMQAVRSVFFLLMGITALVLLITFIIAQRLTRRILRPINNLDLEHPERAEIYEELAPLLRRIANQNRSMRQQVKKLKTSRENFRVLSENMAEGLILLDQDAGIVMLNSSARELLGGDPQQEYAGQHLLHLCRDVELQKLTRSALDGMRKKAFLTFGGREYQALASPVHASGKLRGVVLVFVDVTEQYQAEKMRREFSANVSHELKTPLTVISGYAEMIAGGMVQPADTASFAGRIHKEAGRLLALIEDIMKLSHLDEGAAQQAQKTKVNLFETAKQTAERLLPRAKQAEITLQVKGEAAWVKGFEVQLSELVFNLCENAIKYNKPEGSVTVSVLPQEEGVRLQVEDSGIGIPLDAQGRVFERFYRVDKSRSKDTGGTGLGLSIVKHIVLQHGGKIELESREGQGTCVTVFLPSGLE